MIPVADKSARDNLVAYPGLVVYRMDLDEVQVADGNGRFPDR